MCVCVRMCVDGPMEEVLESVRAVLTVCVTECINDHVCSIFCAGLGFVCRVCLCVCECERGVGSNLADWTGWGRKTFVHYGGWSGLKERERERKAREGELEITCETARLTPRGGRLPVVFVHSDALLDHA